MSKKDLLKQKAKGKLAISSAADKKPALAVVVTGDEIHRITREVRSSLEEMQEIHEWWNEKKERVGELKELVIERLMYVRKNRKRLLGGRTFEEYLASDIGISKGYFYEQLQAYSVCLEYNKPGLFKEVDHKVLVNIARERDPEKQKKLIEKAPKLSREYFKKVSPTDFSGDDDAEKDPFTALVSRDSLSIRVADGKILKQVERLLRANGIKIEYV